MRSAVINYNRISHLHSSWDWVISQHRHVFINACADARMSLSTQHVTVSWSCYCLSFHSHAGLTYRCCQNTAWILKFFLKIIFLRSSSFCCVFQSFWIRCLRLREFYAHCVSISALCGVFSHPPPHMSDIADVIVSATFCLCEIVLDLMHLFPRSDLAGLQLRRNLVLLFSDANACLNYRIRTEKRIVLHACTLCV